jgi:hypothetical protein
MLAVALAAVTALVIGCGSATASMTESLAGASSAPAEAARTFPPPQTPIGPGTYRWDGFEHTIAFDLGSGWALGHDNPSFFDLFRGSDFPSITFARFADVYVDRSARATAADAALVASTFAGRTDMTVSDPSVVEIGGLSGRQFDLAATQPQTPLFVGSAGDFKLDPEFKTRYRVLDFPGGGVLVIGIHARDAGFDAGLALGDPVVATLTVKP